MTAGPQHSMHLSKRLVCRVQPGDKSHRDDQVERLRLERRGVRIPKLMRTGWKVLLPIATLNVLATAVLVVVT